MKAPGIKKTVSAVAEKLETTVNPILPQDCYTDILDEDTFATWLKRLKAASVFAFDTETDGLDVLSANLVGLSFAIAPGEVAYLPMAHDYLNLSGQLDRHSVLERLKSIWEDEKILKIGQNIKFKIGILARYGVALRGIAYDTMLESYVLNSVSGLHAITNLVNRYQGYKPTTIKTIGVKAKHKLFLKKIASSAVARYTAEEVDMTLRLHLKMWPQLQKRPDLLRVFREIEMPLVSVLSHVERTGVLIDASALSVYSQELAKRLDELEMQAHDLAGEKFNLASPKQVQAILYETGKLPVLKRTPGGMPSTNEDVLAELAIDYILPKIILEFRCLAKLKTTYTDKLPLMINPLSGRVHTSYYQAVTSTGRLSSRDPNLQNIPVRKAEGRRIRQAFIAAEGYRIVAADYSQIELRIMAHLSQDSELLKAFVEGKDIHRTTAAEIFGVHLDEVDNEQRRSAKAVNFGLIYGMSSFGLSRQLGVPRCEAQRYMDRYFNRYPRILEYMERTRRHASEKGYVTTLYGRRLYLPDVRSSNVLRRKAAERAAINAPMQGTAADIIKRAMIRLDAWIQEQETPLVCMIMQVHDELVFEVHKSVIDASSDHIRRLMEGSIELTVPLKVDLGAGVNWDTAK
ncbi:DNA polymerase I [Serratia symbiotica]|nr:DNA polymerase I [Serratia symbiotica]